MHASQTQQQTPQTQAEPQLVRPVHPPTLETRLQRYHDCEAGDCAPGTKLQAAVDLSEALAASGDFAQAATLLGQTATDFPASALPWSVRGALHADRGEFAAASEYYQQAVSLNATNRSGGGESTEVQLGQTLLEAGRPADAARVFARLCQPGPPNLESYRGLALAMLDQEWESGPESRHKFDPIPFAARVARRSGAAGGADSATVAAMALTGAGAALFDHGRFDKARECLRRRLAQSGSDGAALLTLARVEDLDGDPATAGSLFGQALQAPESRAEAARYYVEHLIRNGDTDAARHFYRAQLRAQIGAQSRAAASAKQPPAGSPQVPPPWLGQPVYGKTILIQNHGGLGDSIQALRFAALLKQAGARTIFECQPSLVPLLRSFAGTDAVLPPYACAEPVDFTVPGLYLGLMVDWTPEVLAQWMPYLSAHPARVARARRELGDSNCLRIGVAWRGTQLWWRDPSRYRSLRLADLAPVAEVPGVELCSLQFGAGAEDIKTAGFPVRELDTHGMEATAAAIEALDVVISIDSAMAHLACALGKPCLVLLPSAADWRWMNHPTRYPFYPTARLFRQPAPGDWRSVAASVTGAVAETIAKMEEERTGSPQGSAVRGV